jgi:archaellum component FlaC
VSLHQSTRSAGVAAGRELDPLARLEQLEHRERQVTRLWERLVERVAQFPNPVSVRQHEEAQAERDRLRDEIEQLRAEIAYS